MYKDDMALNNQQTLIYKKKKKKKRNKKQPNQKKNQIDLNQPQIENTAFTENKFLRNEMRQTNARKMTNADMKGRTSQKK